MTDHPQADESATVVVCEKTKDQKTDYGPELLDELRKISSILSRNSSRTPIEAQAEKIGESTVQEDATTRIPLSVFSSNLSPLQAVVHYLRDQGQSFKEIAKTTKRSYRSVWGAWQKDVVLKIEPTTKHIPTTVFSENLSIMESVVWHLHEELQMKFSEIAQLLGKDDRTVWTTWKRAQRKCTK